MCKNAGWKWCNCFVQSPNDKIEILDEWMDVAGQYEEMCEIKITFGALCGWIMCFLWKSVSHTGAVVFWDFLISSINMGYLTIDLTMNHWVVQFWAISGWQLWNVLKIIFNPQSCPQGCHKYNFSTKNKMIQILHVLWIQKYIHLRFWVIPGWTEMTFFSLS